MKLKSNEAVAFTASITSHRQWGGQTGSPGMKLETTDGSRFQSQPQDAV